MRYTLTDDERNLRSSLRAFLADSVPVSEYESVCERETGFDALLWKHLAASGWLDLHAMASMGDEGSAWPMAGLHMAEEFGRTLVPAPVELIAGFLFPVLRDLPADTFGLHLDGDAFGDELPAVCVEPLLQLVYPHKMSPQSITVVAGPGGELTLSGRLTTVQFGASAGSLFLPVAIGSEWALVRMRMDAAGMSVDPVKSIDPGRTAATVTLAGTVVPADDVARVGADGGPIVELLIEALLSYLLFLDGKAIGASELLLERTTAYVVEREQFGVPIGSFQAVKHKVAEMATAIESARALASYTAWQVAQRHDDRGEAVLSSRLHAADVYRRVCELAIQCHGGMGFTWEVGLHFWYQSAFFDSAVTDLTMADLANVLGRTHDVAR